MDGLAGEGHEVCDGGDTVQQHKPLAQLHIAWVLVEQRHLVLLQLADSVPRLLLLLQLMLLKVDTRGSRFDVEEVGQDCRQGDNKGVALDQSVRGRWGDILSILNQQKNHVTVSGKSTIEQVVGTEVQSQVSDTIDIRVNGEGLQVPNIRVPHDVMDSQALSEGYSPLRLVLYE